MTNHRKRDGLDLFFDWLVEQKGKRHTTAKTYTSGVRRMLKLMRREPGEPVEEVQRYFDELEQESPSTVANYKTSWRAYADWVMETRGVTIGRPFTDSSQATYREAADLPEEVREGIRAVHAAGVSYQSIHLAVWEDVDFESVTMGPEGTTVLLRDPKTESTFVPIPFEAIDSFVTFGKPGSDLSKPLIPLQPLSDYPYPTRGLQKQAKVGQETLAEKVERMRSRMRPQRGGSALGEAEVEEPPTLDVSKAVREYKSRFLPTGDAGKELSAEGAALQPPQLERASTLSAPQDSSVSTDPAIPAGPLGVALGEGMTESQIATAAMVLGVEPEVLIQRLKGD